MFVVLILMNLRLKINLNTLLPLTIGVLILVSIGIVPIYIYYPEMIDELIDDMIEDQQSVLQTISSQQASAVGNILYPGIEYVLLFANVTEQYYSGKIKIKESFTGEGCSANLVKLLRGFDRPPDFDTARNTSDSITMWLDGPTNTTKEQLDATSQQHLFDSNVMHFIMMPYKILGNFSEIYMTFESDGFFNYAPAHPVETYINFKMPNCSYIEGDQSYYEPRCRSWYISAKANPILDAVTISDPYIFAGSSSLGITICRAIWLDGSLSVTECIGYLINRITSIFEGSANDSTYSYMLNSNFKVILHPDLADNYLNSTIQSLEFPDNNQDEIADFNKNVMPLLKDGQEHVTEYLKDGEEM